MCRATGASLRKWGLLVRRGRRPCRSEAVWGPGASERETVDVVYGGHWLRGQGLGFLQGMLLLRARHEVVFVAGFLVGPRFF
jgi:hypothetical protein